MGHARNTPNHFFLTGTPEEILSPPLQILECRVYRGPHLYSHTPMIRIQVDLGELEEFPTNKLPNFSAKLLECLPKLAQHTCSKGHTGGFVERLHEGTWIGHVIEHVAIELQSMAGMPVTRGKTRSVKGKRGHYNIMYSYLFEEAGLCAGRLALDLVASLLPPPLNNFKDLDKVHDFESDGVFDLNAGLVELKRLANAEKLGPTTQSLVEEAERRGIPWRKLDDNSMVQLGTGRYQKIVRASITSSTCCIAVDTASNKELTKKLLTDAGIPVPKGDVVRTARGAVEAAKEIGFPVVVKPLNANHGRGVSTCLHIAEEVAEAFTRAQKHSNSVIVEQHFTGRDYRVLVVGGEVIAVAERIPAHIIGNGIDTIAKLIETVNADPRRGDGHEEIMTRIKVDDALIAWLGRFGFTLESVPSVNQRIVLAATANLSTGATAIDRTDEIHADNASIARRAALIVGLDIAGIDMVMPNISCSWREVGGGIVEVNASPGFRMHLHPAEGRPRDVAKPVMSALFPPHQKAHVPVIAITGTNGKSTTVRMLSHILRQTGLHVGFTSTSGIFVNDDCIWEGDASGPKSARVLLRDPTIDVAVIETARGGILREGLGVMDCDIGAVLNVTGDHLGIGGIDTIEDLAAVKSVVTESVHRDGVSVLNADDPQTLAIARYAGGSLCYFSMSAGKTGCLSEHIAKGGLAVTREITGGKAQIVLHRAADRIPIIGVNDIPATYGGVAAFNIENALAATAIASAMDVDPQTIRLALSSFTSSFEQNPGRFNIYDGHGFRVIMDYAHNPAALSAFFSMIKEMRAHYLRVIGTVSIPGDRRDEDITEAGRIACRQLDLAFFPELPDIRGRSSGEIHKLLSQGADSVGCTKQRIVCVSHENEATAACLKKAMPGDLVVIMSSDPEGAWKQMLAFRPEFTAKNQQNIIREQSAYA
jgi:cyanophycin synthetase